MPKITCNVKECTYNYDCTCTRKNIDVGGVCSRNKCQTFCESFVPKSDMTMNYEFASFNANKNKELDIYCDAVKCVYEHNQKCNADHVCMRNSNAKMKYEMASEFTTSIKPKKAEVSKDTECATFEYKEK